MDAKAAALIMHDLKNALAVLEGQLQVLSAVPDAERAQQAWRNCGALREKLVAFLTLYKADTHGLVARSEPVNPEDFLRSVLADTPHRPAKLALALAPGPMPVLGFFDEYLVGLALEAALQNAGRFARCAVQVGCRADPNGGIVFEVRDDGPGPLASASAQHGRTGSTGIGMELCRAVAAAHRKGVRSGRCELADAEGGGALFSLYLP